MAVVKLLRFLIIVVYVGYLVNVGLLFVLLPWSRAWGMLMTIFPPIVAQVLDAPWARGALSAFGILHLLLVVWEIGSEYHSSSSTNRQFRIHSGPNDFLVGTQKSTLPLSSAELLSRNTLARTSPLTLSSRTSVSGW